LPIGLCGIINALIKKGLFYFARSELMGATEESRAGLAKRKKSLINTYSAASVTLIAKDGTTLQGMHFPAATNKDLKNAGNVTSKNANLSETGPTVLLCAGNDQSAFHESYESTIKAYLARGINVMCFDYRGVGLSSGTFSERGSYKDVEVAFEYLEKKGVERENILIEGYSMGSGPATHAATQFQGAPLLLRCPFAKTSSVGVKILEENGVPRPVRFIAKHVVNYLLSYDNVAKIEQVTGKLGIFTAAHDQNVREEVLKHGEQLETAYKSGKLEKPKVYANTQVKEHFSTYTSYVDKSDKESRDKLDQKLAQALDEYLKSIQFTTAVENV
jgi:alpha/beta superfamily hydrolase